MTRHVILASAIVVVPALAAAWWWYFGASYQQAQLRAEAEKAVKAEDFNRADELLVKILKDNPNQARPQFLYAQVLRRLGRRQEADLPLLRAIQLGVPESESRREYALLEARDDFTLAEKSLLAVIDSNPGDLEVWQTLAVCYARQRRWPEAEKAYTRWLALEPDRLETLVDRGRVHMESGANGLAREDFREVLKRSPNHYPARLLLAQCLLSDAKIGEAEIELLTCRKLRPASPEPLVGLATCALEKNNLDAAQKSVREALALEPEFILALHLQGDIYLRRQKFDLAVPVFEKLVRRNGRDKMGHYKLAQALSKTNKPDKAKEHEEIFRQLDREDEILRRKERGKPSPGTN